MAVVFAVQHYALIALFALISFIIGRRLTAKLAYQSLAEEIALSTAMGMGAIGTVALLLGMVGWLYLSVMLGVLIIAMATSCVSLIRDTCARLGVSLRAIREILRNARHRVDRRTIAAGLLIVGAGLAWTWIAAFFSLPLYPPTHFDATMYHLPQARWFAETHHIGFLTHMRYPVFPQLNEVLFSLMMMAGDDIGAQLVEYLAMGLVAIALYGWGVRYAVPRAGVWAAALWLASPLVLWLGASAFVDVGLTLFTTMGVYCFAVWAKEDRRGWLITAGAFCGFGAGSKYLALVMVAALGFATIYFAVRHRRYAAPVVFTIATAVVASPWYARTIYYTGNPVFPFAADQFGRGPWSYENMGRSDHPSSPAAAASAKADRRQPSAVAKLITVAKAPVVVTQTVIERLSDDIPALLRLPWTVSHDREKFPGVELLTPQLLWGIPALLLVGAWRLRSRGVLVLGAAYTLLWFTTARDIRYLLPAVPLMMFSFGEALDRVVAVIVPRRWTSLNWVIGAVGFAALTYSGWSYASARAETLGAIPHTGEARDAFLEKYIVRPAPVPPTEIDTRLQPAYLSRHLSNESCSYRAYQMLNKDRGSNYTIYSLFDENMTYFCRGKFLGDWLGPARFANVYDHLGDGQQLYGCLQGMGAEYLLVAMGRVPVKLPADAFFYDHFRPIYDRDVVVYQLLQDDTVAVAGPELLKNPGFETVNSDGTAADWDTDGDPSFDVSGNRAHSGRAAVCGKTSENVFRQTVAVEGGAVYHYRFFARADQAKQTARAQFNWVDEDGEDVDYDIRVVAAGKDWEMCDVTTVAPAAAKFVTLYVSPHAQSTVWFDDCSLVEVSYVTKPPATRTALKPPTGVSLNSAAAK